MKAILARLSQLERPILRNLLRINYLFKTHKIAGDIARFSAEVSASRSYASSASPVAKVGLALVICLAAFQAGMAKEQTIRVFVALCDNKTQGIQPVGERIGDGDKPDDNLYWGCSDGFGSHFKRSKKWKLVESKEDLSSDVLRRLVLKHASAELTITAEAYRGSAMRQCLHDFEAAIASGSYDMVAYIGHNGLMDFSLEEQSAPAANKTDVAVLCCISDRFFGERIQRLGARPVLLTRQLMYPGAFLLHDVIEAWRTGGSLEAIRQAAAAAYARNQKIGVKAAIGIFAPLPMKIP